MSDSTTLTRCPHCQTRFRVTEQQLRVALGKVRCGNCMEVFDARDHAVPADAPAQRPVIPPTATSRPSADPQAEAPWDTDENLDEGIDEPETGSTTGSDSDEDDLIFQDDPEEDATDTRYARSSRAADDDLSDSFLALDRNGPLADSEDDDQLYEEVDESWAEAMLEEDESRSNRPLERDPVGWPRHEPIQPGDDLERPSGETTREPMDRPEKPEPRSEAQSKPIAPRREEPLKATAPPGPVAPEEFSLSVDQDEIRGRNEAGAGPASRPAAKPSQPAYANLRHRPIAANHRKSGWGATVLWGLGCLLLIAVILSQLFYFQFDRLSRYEALRPLYAATCPLVGCELPVMVDTSQIESRKLVVRSHPEELRALLVEASIVNNAPFPQPFPSIVLTFSNLNNEIVAQRAFKPEEYLAEESRSLDLMPEGDPVRISLELRDPGQDAVNYELRFMPMPAGDANAGDEARAPGKTP